jgi:hypothetical protein
MPPPPEPTRPPPGYRGCADFAAQEQARCQAVFAAARRLAVPRAGVAARVQRWRDRRLVRGASPRLLEARRRQGAWDRWRRQTYGGAAIGGQCNVHPRYAAECERHRAAERARAAAHPQARFFAQYAAGGGRSLRE